jgi:hypothetical protein
MRLPTLRIVGSCNRILILAYYRVTYKSSYAVQMCSICSNTVDVTLQNSFRGLKASELLLFFAVVYKNSAFFRKITKVIFYWRHKLRKNWLLTLDTVKINFICLPQANVKIDFNHFILFSQNISEMRFGAYDWQSNEENSRHYGQPVPPLYNLAKVLYSI